MNAIIWVAEHIDDNTREKLHEIGYVEEINLFYLVDIINEKCKCNLESDSELQFMRYLESKYGCDLVTAMEVSEFSLVNKHSASYKCTTQKEIFPILDQIHFSLDEKNAIFDFGCGKGTAILSFLDYGFNTVGGVEFEPSLYNTLTTNFKKLGLLDTKKYSIELMNRDATELTTELDKYNVFYFFQPFDLFIFEKCIINIINSWKRNNRKIRMITINPFYHNCIENTGCFRLTIQMTVAMRQRCVDVYETV